MARPQKCGMDYFPHDTDALSDEKIEALRMLYGNDGYAFYFILLERIYRTENFELDISDAETVQILSRKIGISAENFNQMLSTALKRGCFDASYFEDTGKLTSKGILKRANVVIAKRAKSKVAYDNRVSDAETTHETTTETQQKVHKGKESKGEERKEKNIKELKDNSRFTPPTLDEVKAYCLERNNDVDPVKWYNFYESKGWLIGKNKMKKWKAAIHTWEKGSGNNVGAKEVRTNVGNKPKNPRQLEEWEIQQIEQARRLAAEGKLVGDDDEFNF